MDYTWIFVVGGGICAALAVLMSKAFPHYPAKVEQNKKLVLRRRYWLYYGLTFFSGARRQIFTVFAAFLMVEKFGYSASQISLLFLVNYAFNWLFAERIGHLIARIGERYALTFEYVGLVMVFTAYGLVENAYAAAVLYVVDHMFFALYIATSTYFHKIANPKDLASSAGVSFTINHIAAVIVPASLGLVWLHSNSLVFYIGAGFAVCSLILAQNIPAQPMPGNEVRYGAIRQPAAE
jgi:predicted MFS family arabinose efflux permease